MHRVYNSFLVKWDDVIIAANELISRIDTNKLSNNFGVKLDPDDAQANKTRKEFEKKRDALVEALWKKGTAQIAKGLGKS